MGEGFGRKPYNRIRKWRIRFAGILFGGLLLMGGCGGDYPDLTDEQVEKAGEYAAMTLLKYDSKKRSRLMSLEAMQKEDARRKGWEQAARQVKKQDEEESKEESSTQEGKTSSQDLDQPVSEGKLSDGFTLPNEVNIAYKGYGIYDQYPEGTTDFFSIVPAAGKKLLVLKFQLSNGSEGSQDVDMVSQNNIYRITVNGEYTRTSLPTFLENDLANYQGKLMPGANQEVVLLIEVERETLIESLKMKLKNDRIEYTISLEP